MGSNTLWLTYPLGIPNKIDNHQIQNVLQVFMTQAANVFLASPSPVAPPGALSQQQLLEEQTDTCKRVLNIYRYMVMHVAMDANTWWVTNLHFPYLIDSTVTTRFVTNIRYSV